MQLHCMSDALIIAAALFAFIALWGAVVFLIGWKEPVESTHNKLRRFSGSLFLLLVGSHCW